MSTRLSPTGVCWCGCGRDSGSRSFFLPGHDRIAESAVVMVRYGGVPEFLVQHGFGPGPDQINPRASLEEWRNRGGRRR